MKVFTRVLSLALIAVMLCFSLVSCGGKEIEAGEYIVGDVAMNGCYNSYAFDGENFSYNCYIQYQKQEEKSFAGTYELEITEEDEENLLSTGNITFTWVDASGKEQTETKTIIIDEYDYILTIGDLPYTLYYADGE